MIAAEAERKRHRNQLAHAIQQSAKATVELADAQPELRVFISDFLKGENHGHKAETTNFIREPIFSQQHVNSR